jgi:hypothetical protein
LPKQKNFLHLHPVHREPQTKTMKNFLHTVPLAAADTFTGHASHGYFSSKEFFISPYKMKVSPYKMKVSPYKMKVSPYKMAVIYDHVHDGEYYGMSLQYSEELEKLVLIPSKDAQNVDIRRAEIFLPPLWVWSKKLNEQFPENYKP